MGLHLCYDISLPAECPEENVVGRVQSLREHALTLRHS